MKTANKSVLEVAASNYQPSKAELEEEISLPKMSLEDAGRAVMQPVKLVRTDKPRKRA